MVDTYTKVILTVIAVSLSTIAFKDFFVTPVNAHRFSESSDYELYKDIDFSEAVERVVNYSCIIDGYVDGENLSADIYC